MTPTVKISNGKMMVKKKRTKLHVVGPSEEGQPKEEVVWNLKKLTSKLKEARKRIKTLEAQLETVTDSNDTFNEERAVLLKRVDGMDTRTERMMAALRECMKQLGVARPE